MHLKEIEEYHLVFLNVRLKSKPELIKFKEHRFLKHKMRIPLVAFSDIFVRI